MRSARREISIIANGAKKIRIALLLLFAGIIMLMEFALDQKVGFLLWMKADMSYIVMVLCCIGMLLTVLPQWRKAWPKEEA